MLTNEHVELIIPNGTLAKSAIRNFTKPSPLSRRTVEVQAPYDTSPRHVEHALLGALHAVPGVRTDPAPFVIATNFADSGIAYQLNYFIDDFAIRDRIDSAVRQRVWFAFQRADISIPFPIRTIYQADASSAHGSDSARRMQLFRGVDFLAALPDSALEKLAALSKTNHYMFGEVIIRQGDTGHAFYIIQSGQVSVLLGRGDASVAEVAQLGPGQFFGEMSLMTGEPRTATIQAASDCELVRLDKESFHDILAAAPHLAERISQVLVERQSALEENLSARTTRSRTDDARSHALLSRIRMFFSL